MVVTNRQDTASYHTHFVCCVLVCVCISIYRVFQKTDPLVYFDDNFGKCGPILTIFSLLQQEIYDAQKLSYFSHLTFIMLPLYLAKQTLMLVSALHVSFNEVNRPHSDLKVTKITET